MNELFSHFVNYMSSIGVLGGQPTYGVTTGVATQMGTSTVPPGFSPAVPEVVAPMATPVAATVAAAPHPWWPNSQSMQNNIPLSFNEVGNIPPAPLPSGPVPTSVGSVTAAPPVLKSAALRIPNALVDIPNVQRIRTMVDSEQISIIEGQALIKAMLEDNSSDDSSRKRSAGELTQAPLFGSVFGYDSSVPTLGLELTGVSLELLKKQFKIRDYLDSLLDDESSHFEITTEGTLKSKPNKKRCKSLAVWMTASFKILKELEPCAILYAGYLSYMRRISTLADQYDWFAVLDYDRLYRAVRKEKLVNWDTDFPHLLSGLIKNHLNNALAGGQNYSSKKHKADSPPSHRRMKGSCDKHNTGRGCQFKDKCKFQHVCSICGDKNHVRQFHDKSS